MEAKNINKCASGLVGFQWQPMQKLRKRRPNDFCCEAKLDISFWICIFCVQRETIRNECFLSIVEIDTKMWSYVKYKENKLYTIILVDPYSLFA